jgi:hypothetical protein
MDIEFDVATDVKFEQVNHELFDLELKVNGKSILISN